MFNSMKNVFWLYKTVPCFTVSFDCHSTRKLWVDLHCTLGLGLGRVVFIQSRSCACSGSKPGNVETIDRFWGKGVTFFFLPHPSPLLAAPVTSLVQSQAFLFCENLITVQQQVGKGGLKPRPISSPPFFPHFAVPNVKNLQTRICWSFINQELVHTKFAFLAIEKEIVGTSYEYPALLSWPFSEDWIGVKCKQFIKSFSPRFSSCAALNPPH